ncbi:LysR substrate-binding domain-containing protein [uncultured Psychromonas sp.]|uniref:LysR substrate-binding domain-containing protein n=1 Tax=uncultured Psychromonas sp. TaxID=173974 RepID=UPI00263457B9|nr:LysR substrate-binding domain-containing protein [uncultured Psychromonas sp.]
MKSRLPPLGTLLAFEAAAEHKSFANAAKYLYVTPAAISQQIQTLESHLDLALFHRSKTGVKLTRAGESYLLFVQAGLHELRSGQQHLTQFRHLDVLTISALPSVAQKWLMPLVLEWMEKHPDIEIRIQAGHTKINFNHSASDMCVSFGQSGYTGMHKQKLFTDTVTMVVSPELTNGLLNELSIGSVSKELNGSLKESSSVDDLLTLPMIHIDWGDDNNNLPQWDEWLRHLADKEETKREFSIHGGPRFNLSSMAIEAAVQKKGLLLGQYSLIQNELQQNTLVAPFDLNLPLGEAYYLIYPQRTLDNNKAKAFIDWLVSKLTQK